MADKETHDLYARIPEALWQRIDGLAKQHKRSVTAEVEWALQQYADAHQAPTPAATESKPKKAKSRASKGK